MPYKQETAQAQQRAYYLANKEAYLRRSKERRKRLQAEAAAQRALASIGPNKPKERACTDCGVDITFTYKAKHGERCKECVAKYMAEYRTANSSRIAAKKKAWAEANREHKAMQDRGYAQANPEKRRVARVKWANANPDKDRAAKATNRAERLMRAPPWANRERVEAYYNVCAFFNEVNGFVKYHVDHVIPLKGKKVSGLHVHNNLQVLLAKENLRKGARYG